MKTIVRLRWLFLGVLLTGLLILGTLPIALRSQAIQTRLISEPNYQSLLSRAAAEKIHEETKLPVGVFADQDLVGCNPQLRNQLNLNVAPGIKPGAYPLIWHQQAVWEVRYSTKQQLICTVQGQKSAPSSCQAIC